MSLESVIIGFVVAVVLWVFGKQAILNSKMDDKQTLFAAWAVVCIIAFFVFAGWVKLNLF